MCEVSLGVDLGLFAVSLVVVFASGSLLLSSLNVIARFLRISEFTASFIILAIGTSLPELFIGITSALDGVPALSLGNVIGSNIIAVTLVMGVPVLIARGIRVDSKTVQRDTKALFLLALLPLVLMAVGSRLSRFDGVILIVVFLVYVWRIIRQEELFRKKLENRIPRGRVAVQFVLFFLSLYVLFRSADYTTTYGASVASGFGLPNILIGLFLLALGTSLPELIVGSQAAARRQTGVAMGNVIGTVIANSTLVLGITALITPIEANLVHFFTSASFMLLATFFFIVFASSGKEFDWREGLAMVLFYVFFIIVEFSVQSVVGMV